MSSRAAAADADGAAHVEAALEGETQIVATQEALVIGELAAAQLASVFGTGRGAARIFPLPGVATHVEDAVVAALARRVQRRDQRGVACLEAVTGLALILVTIRKDAGAAARAGGLPL